MNNELPTANYRKGESGQAALILIVILLAILSTIGISFLYRMRLEQRAASNYTDSVKAYYLAEAGIEKAIAQLRNDTNEYDDLYESWVIGFKEELGEGNYSIYEDVENEEGKNRIGIFDEAAKINVNMVG